MAVKDNFYSNIGWHVSANWKQMSDKQKAIGDAALYSNALEGVGDMYAAYETARANAYSLKTAASISEDNMHLAQFGVEAAFKAGESQIAAVSQRAAEVKAKQRVAFSANGVALGVGSTAEAMASTDIQKEVDENTIKLNALQQAWGYRRQRMMLKAQADGQRVMAKAQKSIGIAQMVGTLGQMISSVGGMYGMRG